MSEYPVNKVFPPDFKKYGKEYGGYKNSNQQIIFYDFAAVGSDVEIIYKGKAYRFQNDVTGTYQCFGQDLNGHRFDGPYGPLFKDANDVIQNYVMDDGKHLIDILDEIEHAEPF